MMWLVTLIVLAVLAWFLFRAYRRNADTAAERTALEHDRDGPDRSLDDRRAASGGAEVDGAAGGRDGAGTDPEEMHRVEASVRTQPEPADGATSVTESFDDDSATVAVPGSPDPSAAGGTPDAGRRSGEALDPAVAARAADASSDTGGTGTAVLAGIATAAGAATATAAGAAAASRSDEPAASTDESAATDHPEPEERTNAPVEDTAGTLDAGARHPGASDGSAADGSAGGSDPAAAPHPGAAASATPTGERDPLRDDARTNAPVGDTSAEAAARDPVEATPANTPTAGAPASARTADGSSGDRAPEADLANPPEADTAGADVFRDRSIDARSNLVAGTATLGVGGATAASGPAVLEDGKTPAEHAARQDDARAESDAERLASVDRREGVREMMKILNLRDADATRLGISKEDFARLWQGDAAASDTLVTDVDARLRRMLG